MDLDPRTLAFYTTAISATLAALTLAYRSSQRTYPGFGWWVLSLLAFSVALVSVALPGAVPEMLVNYGPSLFGMAAMLAIVAGQDRFYVVADSLPRTAVATGLGVVAMIVADLNAAPVLRSTLGATTVGGLALYAAWRFVVLAPRARVNAAWFCAVVLALFGATRLWRAGYFMAVGPNFDVLSGGIASSVSYTVNAMFATLWGFGFVFLNASRLEGELEESRTQLQQLSLTDPLTGLRNRRAFFDEAMVELRRAQRYKLPVSLLMFDVDSFKQINDRFGHLAGDRLLKEIALTIARELRTTDIHARIGGEEFAALLVQTPASEVLPTAERLRRAVAAVNIDSLGSLFGTTISIGTASVAHGDAELDELMRYADAALYRAKQAGRNQVVCG